MWIDTPWPGWPIGLMMITWSALVIAAGAVRPWRDAVLLGSVGWGVAVWLATEAQSLGGFLHVRGAGATWAIAASVSMVVAALAWRRRRSQRPQLRRGLGWSPSLDASRREWLPWLPMAGIAGLLSATAIAAWLAPPNTYDAMAYHVPRVLHWTQRGSIAFYPTTDDRQLFMSPWPAYDQLQMYLLWGSDRVANFVQWTATLIALVAATAVAGTLGAGRKTQVLATGIAISTPIVVLGAAATQTDLTAGAWLLVFAAFAFRRHVQQPESWLDVVVAGAAIGLACLSKGTAFLFGAPLVLAYVGFRVRALFTMPRACLLRWATAGAVAMALLAPHTTRMMVHYGHPTTPAFHQAYVMNPSWEPKYLASNLVRNTLTHLGTWNPRHAAPLYAWNASIHEALGVRDGDRVHSHRGHRLRISPMGEWLEESTGNPLHLLLYLLAGAAFLLGRRTCRTPRLLIYPGCLLVGFVLFCLQVKYQHWVSRLQAPLWLLAAPWGAAMLERWWHRGVVEVLTVGLLIAAIPCALEADRRPLIGRDSLLASQDSRYASLFARPEASGFRELARRLDAGADPVVGYLSRWSTPELVLWITLRQHCRQMPEIVNLSPEGHWNLPTPMAVAADIADPPRLLVTCGLQLPWRLTVLGAAYQRVVRDGDVSIYERQTSR